MTIQTKAFAFEIKAVQEDGFFSGYGSVFGVVDSYDDIVAQGAFQASLADWAKRGKLPAMLWQHRASEPIGIYTKMQEDNIGLYVEGQLAVKTTAGKDAYELLKMGAVGGLSIGFVVRDDSWDRVTGVRTLRQVDLWEVSLVTFPANQQAQVTDIKSTGSQIKLLQNLIKSIKG